MYPQIRFLSIFQGVIRAQMPIQARSMTALIFLVNIFSPAYYPTMTMTGCWIRISHSIQLYESVSFLVPGLYFILFYIYILFYFIFYSILYLYFILFYILFYFIFSVFFVVPEILFKLIVSRAVKFFYEVVPFGLPLDVAAA